MNRDKFKKIIRLAIKQAKASDNETAYQVPELFPSFDSSGHSYKAGDRVCYDGQLYKVLQAHTSQASWTPGAAPSLFARVLVKTDANGEQTTISDWTQPDSTNAYKTGDKVKYNGKTYVSTIDNNVWSPSAYPAGWKEL